MRRAVIAKSVIYAGKAIAYPMVAVSHLSQDIRFGLRGLARNAGLASVAVFTLALGIAATATVFSWVDSLLLHPYPGTARSHELVSLEMISPAAPNGGTSVSWPDFLDFRDRLQSLSGVAVRRQCAFTIGDGQPARLSWGELVSNNYFDVLGVQPELGTLFSSPPSPHYPVTVISARLWRSYFHSDPAIIGQTIRVNRQLLTVTGVVPDSFRGGSPILQFDLWVPATMGPALGLIPESSFTERADRGRFNAFARLAPGRSVEQARAEAASFAASLAAAYPASNRALSATVVPPWEEHNGVNEYLRGPLTILLIVSFLVLLIVCANVANLLLARSISRQREFGIRIALGAGRARVATQVLTETLILSSAGAAIGILILLWLQGSLTSMVPSVGLPITTAAALNGRILAFTICACLAAALVSGASPALFVFHTNLNGILKDGGRADTASASSRRTRGFLVIAEVALATVALVGAGLFIQSFRNIRAVNPGFDANNVLLGRFFIETAGYNTAHIQQFALRLKDQLLASSATIEAVTYSDFVPLSTTAGPYNRVQVEGYVPAENESTNVSRAFVAPEYFHTMRIPLVEGREFTLRDDRQSEPVIIVDQAFANRYFQGRSPIGRKVRAGGKWCTVVGLARDSRFFSPTEPVAPHFYQPFHQFYNAGPELYVLVRTAGDPVQAIPLLRHSVETIDPHAGALHPVALAEYTQVATIGQKIAANLLGVLGLLCLLIAAFGLYSVMAYTVTQRIPEIGIRMVMGASPASIIGMVIRQGMALALTGLAVGLAVAFLAARLVANALFHVDPANPATYLLAGFFLAAVALLASLVPALRATRTHPMQALNR